VEFELNMKWDVPVTVTLSVGSGLSFEIVASSCM
jgi:hypothetical protein